MNPLKSHVRSMDDKACILEGSNSHLEIIHGLEKVEHRVYITMMVLSVRKKCFLAIKNEKLFAT